MFFDLNLPNLDGDRDGDGQQSAERVAMAVRLGWNGIAITHSRASTIGDEDRCSIQAVPAEAVAVAARDAAPALAFMHSLLRRPGGGGGGSSKHHHQQQQQQQQQPPQGASRPAATSAPADSSPATADAAAQPPQSAHSIDPAAVVSTASAEGPPAASGTPASAAAPVGTSEGAQVATTASANTAATDAAATTLKDAKAAAEVLQRHAAGFRQLTRFTFAAAEPNQAQLLDARSQKISGYDLLAIRPLSERVFQQACTSAPVDLISLDLTQRLPFRLKPQLVQSALARGLHFEVCYAPALRNPTARRNTFANAQALARATRGRGIVLTSGAQSTFELRGPADVANLGTLFALNQCQSKAAVSEACMAVIQHAEVRRAYKGALILRQLTPDQSASTAAVALQTATKDASAPAETAAAAGTGSSADGTAASQQGRSAPSAAVAIPPPLQPRRKGSAPRQAPAPLRPPKNKTPQPLRPQHQQQKRKGRRKR